MAIPKRKNVKAGKGHDAMPPDDVESIFSAAARDDVEAIKVALQYYDIDAADRIGMTGLHHASANLAFRAARFLLDEGADATLRDHMNRAASWIPIEAFGPVAGAEMCELLSAHCHKELVERLEQEPG